MLFDLWNSQSCAFLRVRVLATHFRSPIADRAGATNSASQSPIGNRKWPVSGRRLSAGMPRRHGFSNAFNYLYRVIFVTNRKKCTLRPWARASFSRAATIQDSPGRKSRVAPRSKRESRPGRHDLSRLSRPQMWHLVKRGKLPIADRRKSWTGSVSGRLQHFYSALRTCAV